MAFPIQGTVRSRAVPAGAVSVSRANDVRGSFADVGSTLTATDDFCLYVGKRSTEPSVFTDLTTPVLVDGSRDFTSLSHTLTGTGTNYSFVDSTILGGLSAGDHLWLCLFNGQSASGSDAVVAVQDLGLAAA